MKIKLFYRVNEDSKVEDLICNEFEIIGKMMHYFQTPDENESGFYEKRLFDYEYDNRFIKEYGKIKLNHRVTIFQSHEDDDAFISGTVGYVHLSFIQKIQLGWIFQRNWLQNPENIKWLLSIPISILTAYITVKITK